MRFIGVDLAWSDRNATGVAVLDGDACGVVLASAPVTITVVDAVAEAVRVTAGDGPAFVAVDAPLLVPTETGRRPCEVELARDFARFHAGPHPANRTRLTAWDGSIAGERLVDRLRDHGFSADPRPETDARTARRLILEAFPHPAIVVLFALEKRLLYKKGEPDVKRAGLTSLQRLVL